MQPPKGITIDLSEQGSDEWKQSRIGRFTASKAGHLMAVGRNGQPLAGRKDYVTQVALERLTGELEEFFKTPAMQEGNDRERTAALAYSFATGNETEQTGFWHTDKYGASPDDLIVGQNGGVEYKNPKAATHYITISKQEVPQYYYWQILQCLLVTGRDFWDYVSFHPKFPESAQLFIKRINRTDVIDDLQKLQTELDKAEGEVQEIINQVQNYKNN
ncbi:MAG: exonuclease [Brevundimonas sp.]|nr:exonuclease [Brevundimonas sp.]